MFPLGFELLPTEDPGIKWLQTMQAISALPCYLERIFLEEPARWKIISIKIGRNSLLLSRSSMPGQSLEKFVFHEKMRAGEELTVVLQVADHYKPVFVAPPTARIVIPPPEIVAECSLQGPFDT